MKTYCFNAAETRLCEVYDTNESLETKTNYTELTQIEIAKAAMFKYPPLGFKMRAIIHWKQGRTDAGVLGTMLIMVVV